MKSYIKGDDVVIHIRNNKEISLKKVHKEVLSIMDEVDRICRKYNITYGLIAGSALGSVNYGGFIPWDDDMDVFILRSDWDKFIYALDQELGDEFYYHCYDKDNRYNILIPQMKIRKKGTYVEEENILLDNRCSGNGIFVDVVTYGDINENKVIDEVFRTIIKLFVIPIVFLDNLGFNPRILKKIVMFIEKKYNNMSKGSKFVSQPITIPWEKFMREPVFLKEDVFPVREYDFEGRKYFSYNNIEKILKEWYGDNCLKKWNSSKKRWEETLPVDKRRSKHVRDINLAGDSATNFGKFRLSLFIRVVFYLALFFLLQFFFDDFISLIIILVVFLLSFIL